jgi:hypothetical protein
MSSKALKIETGMRSVTRHNEDFLKRAAPAYGMTTAAFLVFSGVL